MAVETKAIELGSELGNAVLERLIEQTFDQGRSLGYLEGVRFGIKKGKWKGFLATTLGVLIGAGAVTAYDIWKDNREAKKNEEEEEKSGEFALALKELCDEVFSGEKED